MSTANLNEDIKKAIAANLTGVVAAELQEYLKTAAAAIAKIPVLEERITNQERDLTMYKGQLRDQEALDAKHAEVTKLVADVAAREAKLEIATATNALKVVTAERDMAIGMTDRFLKNVTVRETVLANSMKPVEGHPGSPNNGCYPVGGTLMSATDTTTTTRTEE